MTRRNVNVVSFIILVLLAVVLPVSAEGDEQITISLDRNFGYGGFGGDIQGTFTIDVETELALAKVMFLLDGEVMGEDTSAPFSLKFQTDTYALGIHTIRAVGVTAEGEEIHSNELKREFVSSSEGWKSVSKIAIPIIALAFLFSLLSGGLSGLGKKGKVTYEPGKPINYGPLGGAVCPKCGKPFGRHVWGMNIVVGKLDRCPHCGKWSVVTRAHPDVLAAAEEAMFADMKAEDTAVHAVDEEEQLRRSLDDSRYMDE